MKRNWWNLLDQYQRSKVSLGTSSSGQSWLLWIYYHRSPWPLYLIAIIKKCQSHCRNLWVKDLHIITKYMYVQAFESTWSQPNLRLGPMQYQRCWRTLRSSRCIWGQCRLKTVPSAELYTGQQIWFQISNKGNKKKYMENKTGWLNIKLSFLIKK